MERAGPARAGQPASAPHRARGLRRGGEGGGNCVPAGRDQQPCRRGKERSMSATVKYAFRESRAGTGAPKRLQAGPAHVPEKVPRIARLLALANKFQRMLDSGEVESMAELARLGRVSRARITQIMDLLMLAPEIQEEILSG